MSGCGCGLQQRKGEVVAKEKGGVSWVQQEEERAWNVDFLYCLLSVGCEYQRK